MNQLQQREDARSDALRQILIEAVEGSRQRRSVSVRFRLLSVGAAVAAVALATAVTIPALLPPGKPADAPGSGSTTGGAPPLSIGSRVKLYASLDELIADSAAVVSGSVVDQVTDENGTTITKIAVTRIFSPSGLGTQLNGAAAVSAGSAIRVRTVSSPTSLSTAALQTGANYLLFLTPSGLPGAAGGDFFVTGAGAGLYIANGTRWLRVTDAGDTLPAELTAESLTGSSR